MNFPFRLVDSVCYLPNGQEKFPGKHSEEIQITEVLKETTFWRASKKICFLCTLIEIT